MSKSETDFTKLMEELEEIVEWFDSESVDINKSLAKFERGMEIAQTLKKQLSSVENKVQTIQAKFETSTEG